ncbi:DNA gyrase inhibitor YacG [Candidatus Ichthyocystis hellenicum]|uniref:DNA gyrase inhibitor YacG n=1 Tax=Candidatus Ichthyocystis hellenicum TaxID=1561003 RepID=UPI000B843DD8|nr:DNA gyrase inhibitor YacG [Candidatus Ichthyocystis hellenicum]
MGEIWVSCPICRKKVLYDVKNECRPFCSEDCRKRDWAHWMTESYVMETDDPVHEGNDALSTGDCE